MVHSLGRVAYSAAFRQATGTGRGRTLSKGREALPSQTVASISGACGRKDETLAWAAGCGFADSAENG